MHAGDRRCGGAPPLLLPVPTAPLCGAYKPSISSRGVFWAWRYELIYTLVAVCSFQGLGDNGGGWVAVGS